MAEHGAVPCVYIHPDAPEKIRKLFDDYFADLPRASADFILGVTGELDEDGPTIAEHWAAFLDESGDLHLFPTDADIRLPPDGASTRPDDRGGAHGRA
jgi:hypothetical protein